MVELNCPSCGKLLRIPAEYQGTTGKCNGCGSPVNVPSNVPVASPPPISHASPHDAATEEQIDYLEQLGADRAMLHGITKPQASALMRELRDDPRTLANEIVKAKHRSDYQRAIFGCLGCMGVTAVCVIGLPMCAAIVGSQLPDSPPQSPPASSASAPFTPLAPAPARTTSNITLAKFNQIQTGMSYRQVVSILGQEGEVMSESSFGSGQYATHTIMYTWKAGGFMANMNAMFQNGQMISKAQLGLK